MSMRPPMPVPTLSRRAKLVLGAVGVLLVLFTAIGTLTNVYVDYLWFDETGYTEVFWTELQTRALLFAVAGVAVGGLTALSIYLAYRFRPTFRPMSLEQQNLERYRQSLEPRRGLVLTAVGVVLGLFAGFTAQGSWETWLGFRNSTDFGRVDPQFGIDLSFFVFDYPFYRLALGFGIAIVLLSLIGSLLTHYVFGGLRLQTPGQKLSTAARVQLSVLLGLFLALKSVAYWLDRYGIVYSDRGEPVFTGASYTDVNALLVPKMILVFVAAVCAIAFFANIFVRNFLLPAGALVLLLVSSLVIGVAYPAIVQQFVVKPSADQKEAPVHRAGHRLHARRVRALRRRLRQLRAAGHRRRGGHRGGAGRAAQRHRDHPERPAARPQRPGRHVHRAPADPQRLRLPREARHRPVHPARTRHRRDGPATTWSPSASSTAPGCRRTRTPGSTGTPSTPTATASSPRRPTRSCCRRARRAASRTSPPATCPRPATIDVEQPRIYYGELIQQNGQDVYSVVGAPEGSEPREFDRPEDGSDEGQINNIYDGDGGVEIGSFFRQLTFAIYYRERNFLLSGAVNDQSKVLYVRDPRERVEKAAPFLEIDGDPYPAVIDGQVTWILDGYTTSDAYPYSEPRDLGTTAQDSLTGAGTTALPNDQFNYIRNSVKATVDAYDGTVTLYEWDEEDPVLQTYMKAFPGTVQDREDMPEELDEPRPLPGGPVQAAAGHPHPLPRAGPGQLLQPERPLAGARRSHPGHRGGAAAVLHPGPAAGRRRCDLPAHQRPERVQPGQPVLVHLRVQRSGDLRADPGAAAAGQHAVPRPTAGAAVVQHERRRRP